MKQINFNVETAKEIVEGKRSGQIKTKNGHSVKILTFETKGLFPITGLIDYGDFEKAQMWKNNGRADFSDSTNLTIDLVLEV